MKFFNTYIKSPDTAISLLLSVIMCFVLPTYIKADFALSFYNIGITVLSIIFSLFFAALAIIMSSTDNDFIDFLEDENDKAFTGLMETFKVVLIALFVSLMYSIVLYTTTDYYIKLHSAEIAKQTKSLFIIFQFLFTYSLIATALSISDTLKFTSVRTKFLSSRKKNRG